MARYKSSIKTPFYDAAKKRGKELQPHYEAMWKLRQDLLDKFQEKHHIHSSSLKQLFETRKNDVREEEFKTYDQYIDYMSCYEAYYAIPDRYAKEHNIDWCA